MIVCTNDSSFSSDATGTGGPVANGASDTVPVDFHNFGLVKSNL